MDFTHANGNIGQERRFAENPGSKQVSLPPDRYDD
jgi:hypothetical protein